MTDKRFDPLRDEEQPLRPKGPAPWDRDAAARSFVVRFTSEAPAGETTLGGRVQQLSTGDGGNFASLGELCELLRRLLARRSAGREA